MSHNPIPESVFPPDAVEALGILEARRQKWAKINAPFLAQRDDIADSLAQTNAQLYGKDSVGSIGQAFNKIKSLLTLGRHQGTVLDRTRNDLRWVESTLGGTSTTLEKKAKALGLPADPAGIFRKTADLKQSLDCFSENMVLDPATRTSRKMRQYLDALENGNYSKALKLADKDPPVWIRLFVPWKAQAMRNDKVTLKAGVESYRRTAETIKSAEKLSASLEDATAKALLKVAHSPEWKRLRAQPGLEAELARHPELSILMKYSPADAQSPGKMGRHTPLVLRYQAGNPSLAQLRADLSDLRTQGIASGRPTVTRAGMAKVVGDLGGQVETARQDLKDMHKNLGGHLASFNRILKHTARLETRDTAIAGVKGPAEAHVAGLVGAKHDFDQVRRDLARNLGLEGSPEERRKAREALNSLTGDPSDSLAQALDAVRKGGVSDRTFKRMEKMAQTVAEGGALPASSSLRTAFMVVAPGVDSMVERTKTCLSGIWQGLSAAMSAPAPVSRKERVEPVLGV